MVVLAILFWCWFLTSVVILVRRSIRRRKEKRLRRDATLVALHDGATAETAVLDGAKDAGPEFEGDADVAHGIEPAPVAVTPPAAAPTPPAPTRAPAAASAPTPTPVAAVAAAAPSTVATIARAAAAPVTVAQVIAGIEMPCGLVPLTLSDHDMRYDRGQRAHFVTTLVPAAVVVTTLSEELERIGLKVMPIGDTAALAQRGRLAIEFRISTVGALVDGVASMEFRSAPPNSVVVEFDVVPAA
ncbi:MAG: hypothetical protein ABI658_11225 [Acidimicrobiales bacterium]